MQNRNLVDIKENDIINYDVELLPILLKDNCSKTNIIWATDNYISYGDEFSSSAEITPQLISGNNDNIIKPKVTRSEKEQQIRVKDKAEVFTPSWICNKQNNIIDNAWFDSKNIFNIETTRGWRTQPQRISFPTSRDKTWQDYVKDIRLEISCGEAPYLVSRYDTLSGEPISISNRIGILDRKLRVITENIETTTEWYSWVKIAFQCIYGYEWQGDSLLLARENLFFTFIDYYKEKFQDMPSTKYMREIATIISWNIWQMDGLKCVIPNSCTETQIINDGLFESSITTKKCEGCEKNIIKKHNGIHCIIKDWRTNKTILFSSLLNNYYE